MPDPVITAFHAALLSIADGSVSKTADAAGLSRTALARLRAGKQLNVTIVTLAKLAQAMGKTTDEMLGLAPPTGFSKVPTNVGSSPGLSSRDLGRLRKRLAKMSAFAVEAQAMLPPEDGVQAPEE